MPSSGTSSSHPKVAELVKGAAPPINPFFPTEPLPYYWTYFALPALFAEFHPTLLVDRGILLADIGAGLAFVGVAFVVTRNLGASALATRIAWTTIVVASSFEGAYLIWLQISRGRSIDAFRFTNVDAITRWYWHLPGVDGLHRAMWWHETSIMLGLIVLLVHVRSRGPDSVGAGVVEGVMLGGHQQLQRAGFAHRSRRTPICRPRARARLGPGRSGRSSRRFSGAAWAWAAASSS